MANLFVLSLIIACVIQNVTCEAVYEIFTNEEEDSVRVYPCKGTKLLVEYFSSSQPIQNVYEYRLSIDLDEYDSPLKRGSEIVVNFNGAANVRLDFQYGTLGIQESIDTAQFVIRINANQYGRYKLRYQTIDLYVSVDIGETLPDVTSLMIDGIEQCVNGAETDIWNRYTTQVDTDTDPKVQPSTFDENLSCGVKQVQHVELITSGYGTKRGDWPWHAALYKTQNSLLEQTYICGGSILNPTTVLTAAHCVAENGAAINPGRLFVVLGKYNLVGDDTDSQQRSVFQIIVHEDFNHRNLSNDIALVKLSSEILYGQYVQPVCLWSNDKRSKSYIEGENGYVAGWGFTDEENLSSQLMEAVMPVVSDSDCLRSYPQFYQIYLTDSTFCAGYRNGTSVCNGDSGGGLFFPETVGSVQQWYIRGIVSSSVAKPNRKVCDVNHYVVFTDIASYLYWIEINT